MATLDRRVRKSQAAIKQAVIELMHEKHFDQVTIQDISDRADVSRRTIYLHYLDKYDLLDKLIEEQIGEMRAVCEQADEDADYETMGEVWFEYFERHHLFFSAMLASKGSPFFRTRFLAFFLEELRRPRDGGPDKGRAAIDAAEEVDDQFLGAAIVGVVEWWFKHERPLSPSVMAQRLGALLERNLVETR
ncbi:TetR/AcrR family transcriptional regulator [Paenibacillus sp. 598K]|uniref:TetR/AcrR family transcriptional regulator n=1 Tax=Paenibacillus sp. 598K TaxID=1117987 RepID=UPI000FFE596C|nr:TetR/AcrR family transcriptional regulator [Paenibacillus sp. 598K]